MPPAGFARKLTYAFLAVICVVALTIPVSLYAFYKVDRSSTSASKAATTLSYVSNLQAAIGNLRVDAHDYANHPSGAARATLDSARDRLDAAVRNFANPRASSSATTDVTSSEMDAWNKVVHNADMAVTHVEAGGSLQRFDRAITSGVERPAQLLTGKDRDRVNSLQGQIRGETVSSAALLAMVLCVALALASALAWFIPRSMMHRVARIGRAAHDLAKGELDVRLDDSDKHSDELSELASDFNVMARAMQQRQHENLALQQQLHSNLLNQQERATRDALTGLRNHSYFQDSLAAELERCEKTGGTVSIGMIDLDNFKQVNDKYGHHEGDEVLRKLTASLTENLRPYDLPCRLGGEEFGVIFPETSAEEAQAALMRIMGTLATAGPQGKRQTFSGGVASFPLHAREQHVLFQHADEAAYTAKGNGKAQIVIFDPTTVKAMDSDERLQQRSREAVISTATTLVGTMEQKDPHAKDHGELTAIYAATLARALRLDEGDVKQIYKAGLLHDVGKIGVPESILLKAGRLTPQEYEQVKEHPELSYRILEAGELGAIATWVRHHHEHWDGSGYPGHLVNEQIPLGSRIVLIADAFEAMTGDRVYRKALTIQQAIDELVANAGTQFDPRIVPMMVKLIQAGVFTDVMREHGRHPATDLALAITPLAAAPQQRQQPPDQLAA